MNHINSVLLEGNVAQPPKLVTTSSTGSKLVVFALANNRYYYDADNMKKVETFFLDIASWGELGEKVLEEIKVGTLVRVIGRLRPSVWTDKDGKERTRFQLVAQHIEFNRRYKGGKEQEVTLEAREEDEAREPVVIYSY